MSVCLSFFPLYHAVLCNDRKQSECYHSSIFNILKPFLQKNVKFSFENFPDKVYVLLFVGYKLFSNKIFIQKTEQRINEQFRHYIV